MSLKNLKSVHSNLKIIDNDLKELNLGNLEEVRNNVTISNNPDLELKARSLETVGGLLKTD